ncbi:MAG: hypothetical protein IBJ10_01155 [Phycisphaerales bacterium]|nr:hypothetical protein [Phycisphaerales bacterium]
MSALRFYLPRAVASFDQVESGLHERLDEIPIDELQALMRCLAEDRGLVALARTSRPRRELVRALAVYGLGVIAMKRDEAGRWRPPGAPGGGSGAVLGAEGGA